MERRVNVLMYYISDVVCFDNVLDISYVTPNSTFYR